MTADVVIIGAGIVGVACAEALSRDRVKCTLVEPGVVGGGATAAGMGHVVVMDDSEAEFALTNYSRNLWDRLSSELPPGAEYDECGTLWVAADEDEMVAVRSKHGYYGEREVRSEVLDSQALEEAEPNLRPGLAGGLVVPGDRVTYSPVAAYWLWQRARERGATLLRDEVTGWEQGTVRLASGGKIECNTAICAAGASTRTLFPEIPVTPRKGHLAITDRYPGFLRHQLVELGYLKSAHGHSAESVAFNVQPRKTGQLLIGSSRQYGKDSGTVDDAVLKRMLRRALEYMPSLAGLNVIRTWTGFRPATPDGLPLIGPHPQRERLLLATGHEGLGITTSLGTAQLLADRMAGRTPAIDPAPYSPLRLCLSE